MKRKTILIILFIFIFAIIFLLFSFLKKELYEIKVTDFIDKYNSILKKDLEYNELIRYPNNEDRISATYWVPINEKIFLGIATDSMIPTINLKKDKISAVSLQYEKELADYTNINKYLYYLIKTNNNKIPNDEINRIINQLRKYPNKVIEEYNLIISHNSSNYQWDNIGIIQK